MAQCSYFGEPVQLFRWRSAAILVGLCSDADGPMQLFQCLWANVARLAGRGNSSGVATGHQQASQIPRHLGFRRNATEQIGGFPCVFGYVGRTRIRLAVLECTWPY